MQNEIANKMKKLLNNIFYEPIERFSEHYIINQTPDEPKEYCEQGLPVPPAKTMKSYGPETSQYLNSGKRNVQKIIEIVNDSSWSFEDGMRIMDFGCAAGRMTRWFTKFADNLDIWGTDVLGLDLSWAKQNLPMMNFVLTTRQPHLPFEDNSFDFISAMSVFTHIDDLTDCWLLELRRIIKPGGVLCLSLLDESSIRLLDNEKRPALEQGILSNNEAHIAAYDKYKKMDFGAFFIRRSQMISLHPNSPQVFYNRDFFINSCKKYYNCISAVDQGYGYQSVYLLQKQKS